MSIKEVEAAALKLVPRDRARLAGKLLESLEELTEEENEAIWAQEAERRDARRSSSAGDGRSARRVLRSARAKLTQMDRVSFHQLAERELNDAALYYEHESAGLGASFLDEIERHIEATVKHPISGTKL